MSTTCRTAPERRERLWLCPLCPDEATTRPLPQDVLGKRRNGGVTEYLIRWKARGLGPRPRPPSLPHLRLPRVGRATRRRTTAGSRRRTCPSACSPTSGPCAVTRTATKGRERRTKRWAKPRSPAKPLCGLQHPGHRVPAAGPPLRAAGSLAVGQAAQAAGSACASPEARRHPARAAPLKVQSGDEGSAIKR